MIAVDRHKILFLVLAVLVVYYPAITETVNYVDDVHIIDAYGLNGHLALKDILFPGGKFYYRPVIELSYYLDNLFWGLDARAMHLENVLFHIANAVLVFLVAGRVSTHIGGMKELPLVSSLIFALHPVNTEAVSWIAGRTDPLAALFVLLSVYFLLRSMTTTTNSDLAIAIVSMLFAALTKETAIFVLPAALIITYSFPLGCNASPDDAALVTHRKKVLVSLIAVSTLVLLLIIVQLLWKRVDNAFSMVLQGDGYNLLEIARVSLKTLGFYVTKFFFPFPLNFAIITVNDYFIPVGVTAALLTLCLLFRKSLLNSLYVTGIIFLIPPLVVAVAKINWTPVAERYLYIPAAFFAIGFSSCLYKIAVRVSKERAVMPFAFILALPAGFMTTERNLVWRDNLSLYQDSVNKSPAFGDVHNELGVALMKNGRMEEAKEHFKIAEKLSNRPLIREFAGLNLLSIDLQDKTPQQRKKILLAIIKSKDNVHLQILRMLRDCNLDILNNEMAKDKQHGLAMEIIALNDRLYLAEKNPHSLYINGQMALLQGNTVAALGYFRRTVSLAPDDAYYKAPARKLVRKLESR
jgi:protein O-mannosyl-transferase